MALDVTIMALDVTIMASLKAAVDHSGEPGGALPGSGEGGGGGEDCVCGEPCTGHGPPGAHQGGLVED